MVLQPEEIKTINCARCGREMQVTVGNKKYCIECAKQINREKARINTRERTRTLQLGEKQLAEERKKLEEQKKIEEQRIADERKKLEEQKVQPSPETEKLQPASESKSELIVEPEEELEKTEEESIVEIPKEIIDSNHGGIKMKKLVPAVEEENDEEELEEEELEQKEDPKEKKKRAEDADKYWKGIQRGLYAVNKEYAILKSFSIARSDLRESHFIHYLVPHIRKMSEAIESMFSILGDTIDETKFLMAFNDFMEAKKAIEEEIAELKKDIFEVDDVYVRMVSKFVKMLTNYTEFILKEGRKVLIKYDIRPPE